MKTLTEKLWLSQEEAAEYLTNQLKDHPELGRRMKIYTIKPDDFYRMVTRWPIAERIVEKKSEEYEQSSLKGVVNEIDKRPNLMNELLKYCSRTDGLQNKI